MTSSSGEPASAPPARWAKKALEEVGLLHLWHSNINVKLLCLQRFVRLFAYGAQTLILVAYLKALGISDTSTGLFMTLTAVGDVVMSLCLTLVADRLGRRRILAFGALMMCGSGIVFGTTDNYWILLAAAVIGVITPSGNEIGPFRAIEESTLAHLTKPDTRPSIFAWYILLGTAGAALGLMTCGWTTTLLIERKHWPILKAHRVIFFAYALLGGVKLLLAAMLGKECEADQQAAQASASETQPLLNGEATENNKKNTKFSFLPRLSRESKIILVQLCILMAFDNFASGLATLSWTANYFQRKFELSSGKLGSLFFTTSIVAAVSVLFAASLARRIGNVKTMVFTHLPSSICLALIGIPSKVNLAVALVVLRACTQSMDTAPRSAFLSAVVLPEERTVTIGVINVVKTLAQSLGPTVTGVFADRDLFWVAFLIAGCLKAGYDVGMLLLFAGHKTREERLIDSDDET